MVILIKGAQLILSLSILVVLHELGHFIPARLFGTRVEKFYLFFDPWFSLWKKKWKGTEFGIGWVPFGGYVKISGMVDESMDKEQMAKPPEPYEFRSKPAWQRLVIMVGGVTVNLILGMVIYIGILWHWGREFLPVDQVKWGVHPSAVMAEQGVQEGDIITTVDGVAPKTLEEVGRSILIDGKRTLGVQRNGEAITLQLPGDIAERIMDRNERSLLEPRVPFTVDSIVASGTAAKSDLRKGDRMLKVNEQVAEYFTDFRKAVMDAKGSTVLLAVERGGDTLSVPVEVNEEGAIGVYNRKPTAYFAFANEQYTFAQAIPAGIRYGVETLGGYVRSLKLLFTRSGAGQIGGFGAIGGLFSPEWDWEVFWNMTAFLSIVLAFMNILPIPALDGGHVVFLLYEMVFRRPPHQRVLEVAQMIGMVLLLMLLLFANGNDLFRAFTK